MSKIKLFVTHTSNRKMMCVWHPLIYNVIAGSDFQTEPVPEGMLLDNTGENISFKNKSYCELTTQYWAWKNQNADYYGFCHYRRYFSFNPVRLQEADCGCLVYPVFNEKISNELQMDEYSMHRYIEKYDFLIAKGIPMNALQAKSVYQHYQKASELHIKDLDLMIDILREKYPAIVNTAEDYIRGKIFYPCNMFIMKKELFQQYSEMLFSVLEEFESRSDMSRYSREGGRTPGHLGERMIGIFYEYLKKKGGYCLGELQMALIEQTDEEPVCKRKKSGTVPVVLAANEKYVPILYICLSSIIFYVSDKRQYDIYIFHTDIKADCQKELQELQKENVTITFVNVFKRVTGYRLKAKEHITAETFYRFLIPDILGDYPKVVYLDCDMIIHHDVAELFDVQLGDNLLGAAVDPDFAGQCNGANPDTERYCNEILKLRDPFTYFQAGVLVLNVVEFQKSFSTAKLFEMSDTGIYRYSDQDILNIVCEGRVTYLDMKWNMVTDCNHYRWHYVIKSAPFYIMDAYEKARKNPYIIHYAGAIKPWKNPKEDFAEEFWKVARTTPYYEQILYDMCGQKEKSPSVKVMFVDMVRRTAKKILPQGSWIRRTVGGIYWRLK